MPTIFFSFFQMAILILLGVILRRLRIIDERVQHGLTNILVNAVLPFNLLSSSQYEYSREMSMALIATACAAACYFTFAILGMRVLSKRTKFSDQEQRVLVTTAVFMNAGFIGFPLMQAVFGAKGLLLASCYNMVFNLFMYSYGEHKISGQKVNAKMVFTNPVTLTTVVAIVLFLMPWRMPEQVKSTIDIVGNMTVPLSMMIIGSTLSTIDVKKLFVDKVSYLATSLRLIIFPLIMFGAVLIVRRYFYMMPVTASTIVLMTALPCGSMNVVFCEKFNCAPKLCARNFTQTVVLMIITLPLFLMLCTKVFGI